MQNSSDTDSSTSELQISVEVNDGNSDNDYNGSNATPQISNSEIESTIVKLPIEGNTTTNYEPRRSITEHRRRRRCLTDSTIELQGCFKRNKYKKLSYEKLLTIAKVSGHRDKKVAKVIKRHLLTGILEADEMFEDQMSEAEKQSSSTTWCDCETAGPVLSHDECVCCHSQLFLKFKLGNKECIVKLEKNL